MKTVRPTKRSVSPFGAVAISPEDPLASLRQAVAASSFEPSHFLPDMIAKVSNAPANDAPGLDGLIQSILKFRETLNAEKLSGPLFDAMMELFERKTELFLIAPLDDDKSKYTVLFAKERDALAGRFFAPFTESQPGLFSQFVTRWMESDNPDRILHLLDFCAGSKNPTFEHYLLFTHPALARVISNKAHLRELFDKAAPVLSKMARQTDAPSVQWEKDVRAALAV